MLSRIATPRSFIPILPTMPASVSVSTRRPSGCSIVHTIQPSASSLCQSHVWIPSAEPDAVIEPRQAMVEHSPADGGQQLGARVQRGDRLDGEARARGDALDLGPQLG